MAPGGSYTQVPGSPSQLPLRHARKSSLSSRRGIPSRWRTGLICSTVALLLLGAIAHQSSSRLLGRKENELETLRGEKEGSELMGDGWRKKEDEAELVSDEAEVEAELQVEKSEQEPEWAEVGDEDVGADANQDVRPSEVEDEPVEEQGKVNDSVLDESEEVDQEIHRIEADEARLRAEAEQDGEEELCSDTVRNALSLPSFWYIRSTGPTTFAVSPRSTDHRFPFQCLSHAVFSARLVRSVPASEPGLPRPETILALPRPLLQYNTADYSIRISPNLVLPRASYRLDVRLEFGLLEGALQAQVCGEEELACQPQYTAEMIGEEVGYVGGIIEFEETLNGRVDAGISDIRHRPPLCTSFYPFNGYWEGNDYHPTPSSTPCRLVDSTFPIPFVPKSRKPKPIWLAFVGDSNTRNMFSLLAQSLGSGPYTNAVVTDSPEHNGTVATIALRSSTGDQEYGDDAPIPSIILTWSWWYGTHPEPTVEATDSSYDDLSQQAWDDNLVSNREKLLFLTSGTLSQFASRISLQRHLGKPSSPLAKLTRTLRPTRTFLSLGSHGEQLTSLGMDRALDFLLAEDGGISAEMRELINLRLFTTTLVNPLYIPLDRFPHQDLVRNNPAIEARNRVARERPEFRGEGRVIDIEAMVRGVTEGWMKETSKGGMDAVHFRPEGVYETWVKVVWTELMVGVEERRGR